MARILIVDDSEQSRILLRKILSENDHEVHLAKEAFEAMESLDKFHFDLLLLDINMPFKDGFSTLKALKDTLRFKTMPIAMITGRNEPRDVKKAISLGAESYILKPFEKEDVLEKVEKLLLRENTQLSYQLDLEKGNPFKQAALSISSEIELIHVSESGVIAITDMVLQEGKEIVVQSPIFDRVGIKAQRMKIADIKKTPENLYKYRLIFKTIEMESLQKIKNWILSQKNARRADNAS